MPPAPAVMPVPSRTRLGRALRLRCPACGGRGMLRDWLHLVSQCPSCGLRPDRGEPDHFLGGYVLNLGIAEAMAALTWLILLLWQWPNPNWELLQWGAAALMIALPFAIYPFTRLIFLATDLGFQPRRPGDFGDGDPTYK